MVPPSLAAVEAPSPFRCEGPGLAEEEAVSETRFSYSSKRSCALFAETSTVSNLSTVALCCSFNIS
eukprot:6486033-Prorocentrum_lima.AAC.1